MAADDAPHSPGGHFWTDTRGMGVQPFLKWAGGKRRLAGRIQACLPPGQRLVEPFVGSAAVFLHTGCEHAWLTDVNPDLIGLYQALQSDGERFVEAARALFTPEHNQADRYYAHRAYFNATQDSWERALLFLYLNRHGYNGLARYNAAGAFNVPFGRYTRPYFPEVELRGFIVAAGRAIFAVADFRTVMAACQPGDVVYCDPPYVPLSATAHFTAYAGGGFGATDQRDLADAARQLAARGIPVLISNHDTPWTQALYRGAQVEHFAVRRFISCDGQGRNTAQELLALFAG